MRIADMFGEWDVEAFLKRISKRQLEKWQAYLLYKVETESMISAINSMGNASAQPSSSTIITDMNDKASFLQSLAG